MYDATMKYTNEYLRGVPEADLRQMGQDARQSLLELRTAKAQAGNYTAKPHLFGKVRRDIARIETHIRKGGAAT